MKKNLAILSLALGALIVLPGCLKKKDEKKAKAKKTALVKRTLQKEMIEDTTQS